MKRPEHLIAAGLLGSVVVGSCAYVILRIAERSVSDGWPLIAAINHPGWLAIGEILGVVACLTAGAALFALASLYGRSSALAAFGAICLGISIPGVIMITALDLGYARKAQDRAGLPEALFFAERWQQWNVAGWLMFAIGGLVGLVALGVGLARTNQRLRRPAIALAVAAALILVLDGAYAGILLALSLAWIARALWRLRTDSLGPTESNA